MVVLSQCRINHCPSVRVGKQNHPRTKCPSVEPPLRSKRYQHTENVSCFFKAVPFKHLPVPCQVVLGEAVSWVFPPRVPNQTSSPFPHGFIWRYQSESRHFHYYMTCREEPRVAYSFDFARSDRCGGLSARRARYSRSSTLSYFSCDCLLLHIYTNWISPDWHLQRREKQ